MSTRLANISSQRQSLPLLVLLWVLLTWVGTGCRSGPTAPSDAVRAIQPFIDESFSGDLGSPDPFIFQHDSSYYIFGTTTSFFRTRTFTKNDIQKFQLHLDYGMERGKVKEIWRFVVFVDTDGLYHGYATLHYGWFRTVLAYFAPLPGQVWSADEPITRWKLQKILIGDVSKDWRAYDCNLLQDENGDLWFIYNAGHPKETVGSDIHIKAQKMLNPQTLDTTSAPRILLSPEGFESEDRNPENPRTVQIVESVIIQKLQGRYVLFYSVGDFDDSNYKIGVAYSETLIPPPGKAYQKVLIPDPKNVWNNPPNKRGKEVLYLLQTQKKEWPNYVGDYMNGPGIGSVVRIDSQDYLIFHARKPGQTRLHGRGRYVWKLPVIIQISEKEPVSSWIHPVLPKP